MSTNNISFCGELKKKYKKKLAKNILFGAMPYKQNVLIHHINKSIHCVTPVLP